MWNVKRNMPISFKNRIFHTNFQGKDLDLDWKVENGNKNFKLEAQLKGDNWYLKVDDAKELEFKNDGISFTVEKPESGSLPFPNFGIKIDNKEIELPWDFGKLESSAKISVWPLQLELVASLKRSQEVEVPEEIRKKLIKEQSIKIQDVESEDAMFQFAGSLIHVCLIMLGLPWKIAGKITINFKDFRVSPVQKSKNKIKIDDKQSVKLILRPHVTLQEAILFREKKRHDLHVVKNDFEKLVVKVNEAINKYNEEIAADNRREIIRASLVPAIAVTTAAAVGATVFCWNPVGWISAAILAKTTAEISTLCAVFTSVTASAFTFNNVHGAMADFDQFGNIFPDVNPEKPEELIQVKKNAEAKVQEMEQELNELENLIIKLEKENIMLKLKDSIYC